MGTQLSAEKRQPLIFGPCIFWPNGWMDEDATWYGSKFRPRPHCVRRGLSSPRERGTGVPLFSAHDYCGQGRPSRLLLSSCSYTVNGRPFPKKLFIPMGIWTPFNTRFPGPTRALNRNGISVGSAVLAGLISVTDRLTDRPRFWVGDNRLQLRA